MGSRVQSCLHFILKNVPRLHLMVSVGNESVCVKELFGGQEKIVNFVSYFGFGNPTIISSHYATVVPYKIVMRTAFMFICIL